MSLKCRLIGHSIDKNFTDGGYCICTRCQMHEYWQSRNILNEHDIEQKYSFEDSGLLLKPLFYIVRQFNHTKRKITQFKNMVTSKFVKDGELPF